jgi:hypothetical protein
MILITHSVVGAALSGVTGSPVYSFLIGILSHYVLDAVPHYDYVDKRFVDDRFSKQSKVLFKFIMLDGVLGVILPLYFFEWQGFYGLLNIFLAIIGAMLPDALTGVHVYFPNKVTPILNKFHVGLHYLFSKKLLLQEFPIFGLCLQASIVTIIFWVIPA